MYLLYSSNIYRLNKKIQCTLFYSQLSFQLPSFNYLFIIRIDLNLDSNQNESNEWF